MVRTRSGPTEYKFVASKRCPNGELPSDPLTDRHRQTPKLCKKPLSQFIIAPRAQASRRCETQASLSGKAAKLWLAFRSLDLFRALREPDRRRRDEERPFRSEQKTATNQNDYLTGKAPYKSWAAVRGVYRASPSPRSPPVGALRHAADFVSGGHRTTRRGHLQGRRTGEPPRALATRDLLSRPGNPRPASRTPPVSPSLACDRSSR